MTVKNAPAYYIRNKVPPEKLNSTCHGTMTPRITTLSIITFSIMSLNTTIKNVTLSITTISLMTLNITTLDTVMLGQGLLKGEVSQYH